MRKINLDAEVGKLTARYGIPPRWTREYVVRDAGMAAWVRGLERRRGEVVFVVPRGSSQVLLHTKPHYPVGAFRLPSGGIDGDEAVDAAGRRELYEELGFHGELKRLLGVIENVFIVDGVRLVYPSYIFETEPLLTEPHTIDPNEQIAEFRDVPISELGQVARALDALPDGWRIWGAFRARRRTRY